MRGTGSRRAIPTQESISARTAIPLRSGQIPNVIALQLPQSALGSKTPLQAMKEWHKLQPELFKKQPYYLTGCDR